jgi:hypothetical protein
MKVKTRSGRQPPCAATSVICTLSITYLHRAFSLCTGVFSEILRESLSRSAPTSCVVEEQLQDNFPDAFALL